VPTDLPNTGIDPLPGLLIALGLITGGIVLRKTGRTDG
jgi:LPXTG-motif cell wall-anchored protein